MTYTLTFQEVDYQSVIAHLFPDRTVERAAYLLCSVSISGTETRLIVTKVIPVADQDTESATSRDIVIKQRSYRQAIKAADTERRCFVLVHSHPEHVPEHSTQDDREERDLFKTAYTRIHHDALVHGSIILSSPARPVGRVWLPTGETQPIQRIRIIGNRFAFYDRQRNPSVDLAAFDRQIRAFGTEFQELLGQLVIGVVGLGGTGSAVCEQLARLGVGTVLVVDPQPFDRTNVNRVYGSSTVDHGTRKTEIAARNVERIGLGTRIIPLTGSVVELPIAQRLKECDVIFGCTDDETGRAILNRIAATYIIPLFDMGVEVDSDAEAIKTVTGRVTTFIPGSPCVFCRGIVTSDVLEAEMLHRIAPKEYEERTKLGYTPALPGVAPSIIMFTSTVASMAISELLHRFTGYMGNDRLSTEVILRFDESKISTNSKSANPQCWCTSQESWGIGDVDPYVNLAWISST